jgi:hypothetical protein
MRDVGTAATLAPGVPVAVVEEWRGSFWSKRLQRVVSWESDMLATFERAGSLGRFPRYRDATDEMSRDERKMMALQSGDVRYVTAPSVNVDCLRFYRADRWASVARGYLNGDLIGWYVDFGLPPRFEPDVPRIVTMDLVLDALVTPDGEWEWKDEAEFERGLALGVLDAAWEAPIRAEAHRVRQDIALGVGAFSREWDAWGPPDEWGPLDVRDPRAV